MVVLQLGQQVALRKTADRRWHGPGAYTGLLLMG